MSARSGAARPKARIASTTAGMLISERVYRQLKRDIVTGVFEPGSGLTESLLTQRFKASRTPIREACARLQSESLLELAPNKGYSISAISFRDIQELFQLRSILENFAVQKACTRSDTRLLGRLDALAQVHHVHGDRASYLKYLDANFEFHVTIAELAGNRRIARLIADVMNQLARAGYASLGHESDTSLAVQHHTAIVKAIKEGNPKGAQGAIGVHIEHARETMLKAV